MTRDEAGISRGNFCPLILDSDSVTIEKVSVALKCGLRSEKNVVYL